MAYSDYGAFVYRDGTRRRDKEDVGVYDTDEGALPSGYRIFANIMKNQAAGSTAWHDHSHHGVLGDGPVRVGCYKQGLPSSGIYHWPEGTDAPERFSPQDLTATPRPPSPDAPHGSQEWDDYFKAVRDYDYDTFTVTHDFGTGEYQFTFTDKDTSDSGHYEATMTEPDGTRWHCAYDYRYGAGLTDQDGEPA